MKIMIVASGSRGDVQPYIALAKGLNQAGHVVSMLTHDNFEKLVTEHGVACWPVAVNVQDIAQNVEMTDKLEKGNFLGILAEMAKSARQAALMFAEAGLESGQEMDVVLGGMGGLSGIALAEKLEVPFVPAYLVPFTPTRVFPAALMPKLPAGLGWLLNYPSHVLMRQMIWQGFRSADTAARTEVLGLAPAPLAGPFGSPALAGMPTLYGFSPAVVPPPKDWGEDIHVTGDWLLEADEDWRPPQELVQFLEAGPSPVYVGFGSMSTRNPEETANLVIEALQRAGQRGIMLSGWGGLAKTDLPESILMLDSAPHAWLFPRMAAVVHHGGAGTTGAGLAAGVPTVVVPFFGDQPYWGQRVVELGVGPAPIARRRLTATRLAEAIRVAVTDMDMRARASALGERIRAEDGAGRAAEVINQVEKRLRLRK